jgi:hypothetical protein
MASTDESTHQSKPYLHWKLKVLKAGIPIGEICVGPQACLLLGREGDGVCDVVLEHPSIRCFMRIF